MEEWVLKSWVGWVAMTPWVAMAPWVEWEHRREDSWPPWLIHLRLPMKHMELQPATPSSKTPMKMEMEWMMLTSDDDDVKV
jgi:hypothetical protein